MISRSKKSSPKKSGGFSLFFDMITILHTMTVSMNPTWLGETQKRFAQFKDGLLTITADVNDSKLIWKKAK
nr:lipocalin-like domain-containing protein [Listeria valentina]